MRPNLASIFRRNLSKRAHFDDLQPRSTVQVFTSTGEPKKPKPQKVAESPSEAPVQNGPQFRQNDLNIQMLSRNLFEQIFGSAETSNEQEKIAKYGP
jgi:hypothetical protein